MTDGGARPIGIDLFCGCGGMSLGVIQAGIHIIAAADWDCAAAVTYMCNLCRYGELTIVFIEDSDRERLEKWLVKDGKHHKGGVLARAGEGWIRRQKKTVPGVRYFFLGDVRKLTGDAMMNIIGIPGEAIDCVFGGPPCQGFSYSGQREVIDPRNSLVFDFMRLALEIRPKTIMFENVPGITTMVTPEGIPVMDALGRILEDQSFATFDAVRRAMAWQAKSAANLAIFRGRQSDKTQAEVTKEIPGEGARRMNAPTTVPLEYAVKAETKEGNVFILRRGFPSEEAAGDHPVTLALWKRVWIEPVGPMLPTRQTPVLPPTPWDWITSGTPSGNGHFHAYLVDGNGRKIAAIWGKDGEKALIANHIIALINAHAQGAINAKDSD